MRPLSASRASNWSRCVSSPNVRFDDERYVVSARRQEQLAEGVDLLVGEPLALVLGRGEHRDDVVGLLAPALGHDAGEVVAQRGRRRECPFPVHGHADELDGQAVELGEVLLGQPQQRPDHPHGKGEQQLAHEIGPVVVDELVDHAGDQRSDQLDLPPLHLGTREGLLEDRPVGVGLGLVHLQDRATHDDAHHLAVARRAEGLAVAEDGVDGVVGIRGERGRGAVCLGPVVGRARAHRRLRPQTDERRVRGGSALGPHRPVELIEGVVVDEELRSSRRLSRSGSFAAGRSGPDLAQSLDLRPHSGLGRLHAGPLPHLPDANVRFGP
jgi:hypothetical protein